MRPLIIRTSPRYILILAITAQFFLEGWGSFLEETGKRAIREEGEATDSLARNEAILARIKAEDAFLRQQDDRQEDFGPDLLDSFAKRPSSSSSYAFGLGKRGNHVGYGFGLGRKRNNPYAFGLGKRSVRFEGYGEPIYGFGLGKRNPYTFGLGKREEYSLGLGKRSPYTFGLEYKRDPYVIGLGK